MEPLRLKTEQKRKILYYLLFNLGALAYMLLLSQCTDKVETTKTYRYMKPVYTTTEEIRAAVDVTPPQPIVSAGKIYYLNGFLYINEPGKGIHVIDNTDPSRPVPRHFINIPGNYDMAAKGNLLYADSYVDMVVFDISQVEKIQLVNRVEDVFDLYRSYTNGFYQEGQIITEWVETEEVEIIEGEADPIMDGVFGFQGGVFFRNDADVVNFARMETATVNTNSASLNQQIGVGGSMARFTITGNHLYSIDDYSMQVFDISQAENPVKSEQDIFIGFMIETIFPYQDKLFIGAQSGMHIYDNSNPENPVHLSTYEHITSCDPVVVEGNLAYVTLRGGTECRGFSNQLEVIDVEDPTNPQLLHTFAMQHPHGLGIDNGTLFICEGEFGLKAFDASDVSKIDQKQLMHISDIHAYDVIPLGGVLMMIGNDGLYQYDYSNPKDIKLLSKIALPGAS
ncbi:MAG: LVIVD repeat-containing protein [Cyclobacteriaceae bacterium]